MLTDAADVFILDLYILTRWPIMSLTITFCVFFSYCSGTGMGRGHHRTSPEHAVWAEPPSESCCQHRFPDAVSAHDNSCPAADTWCRWRGLGFRWRHVDNLLLVIITVFDRRAMLHLRLGTKWLIECTVGESMHMLISFNGSLVTRM